MWIVLPVAVVAIVLYAGRRVRRAGAVLADERARACEANALDKVRRIAADHNGDDEAIRRELDEMFEQDEMPECDTSEMDIETVIAALEQAIADRDMRNQRARIEKTLRKGR